jgi:hypothetical protein
LFVVCNRTIVDRVTCWGSHERIETVYQTQEKPRENKRENEDSLMAAVDHQGCESTS